MKNTTLNKVSFAVGLALASSAGAGTLDFTGSNIYMKYLDGDRGNQETLSTSGGAFDSGTDQAAASEFELRIKSQISKQVEAGARIKSRFNRNYWSENGGFANEGNSGQNLQSNQYMKLRGAYVNLTPGYSWLSLARIGSSDWGMFDPFTFGKMRYIDRDNVNGLYFKGPVGKGTWELARISLLPHLGAGWKIYADTDANWTRDDNTALFGLDRSIVAQLKYPVTGDVDATAIYEHTQDQEKDGNDTTPFDGTSEYTRSLNTVIALKLDIHTIDWMDVRLAYYDSDFEFEGRGLDASGYGGPLPADDLSDRAYKLNLDFNETPVDGLSVNVEYFDIGAGYASVTAARRESDVLLTDGSEAAWFNHGNATWVGGIANEMQQVANYAADNDEMDFDEPAAEAVIGWKGLTAVVNYEVADTPMSLEITQLDYNTNWQNYDGDATAYSGYGSTPQHQDRDTTIIVFKAGHVYDAAGGLDASLKIKLVDDEDKAEAITAADDRKTEDTGYSIGVGNQLTNDLYGNISFGSYTRDVTLGGTKYANEKNIFSLRFNYNLSGFESGMVAQWINGDGDPNQDGTKEDLEQYRLKVFAKVLF